jgi:hypothetical protein
MRAKRTTFYLESNEQTSYIKPSNYERSKKKKYRNNQYLRENMGYDEAADEYTCPNHKKLKPIGMKTRKSKSGYKSEITVYECEDCSDCSTKQVAHVPKGIDKWKYQKAFKYNAKIHLAT